VKILLIGIGIVIIGALFIIQDFGSQTITGPVQSQPTSQPAQTQQNQPQNQCDSSYPSVCIPLYPPDLDCGEIGFSNFRVIQPDPHGFDRDRDGIGCEVGYTQSSEPVKPTQENNCDPSYPDVCIAVYPPDLDCGEIGFSNFRVIQPDPHGFDGDRDGVGCEVGSTQPSYPSQDCSGNARCIVGKVTQVIDGDTIRVDGKSIRFALASAPELHEFQGEKARQFIDTVCPIGSTVLVDEDDGQTEGSYGRIIGVIYCNDLNLNEELLDSSLGYLISEHCSVSEFSSSSWAQKYGCATTCDPSYPDVCIPSPPPDLDCGEIGYSNFRVIQPDPHGFDGDRDGIGCEVGSPSEPVKPTQENNCDPSYPDVCIAVYPPDLDCGEISFKNFRVLQPDPHGFDGDKDGIGCES